MYKSKLYRIGVDNHFLQAASQFIACKVDAIPFKFLGIKVKGNHMRGDFWNPMTPISRARLSSWKGRFVDQFGIV